MRKPNLRQSVEIRFPSLIQSSGGDIQGYVDAHVFADITKMQISAQAGPGDSLVPREVCIAKIRAPFPPESYGGARSMETPAEPTGLRTPDGKWWDVVGCRESNPPYTGFYILNCERAGGGAPISASP